MTVIKKHGSISSREVRETIQKLMNDTVLGTLFGQHVIWQGMSDITKVKEPDDYFAEARKSINWVRTKREKTSALVKGTRTSVTAWHRIYECKVLKGLEPKFSIDIITSEDELNIYRVSMVYWLPRSNDPIRKEISVTEAFPHRLPDGSLPQGKLCILRTLRAFMWEVKNGIKITYEAGIKASIKNLEHKLNAMID